VKYYTVVCILSLSFHEQVSFKTLKELKQACTMLGPTAPFTAYYRVL
jgi:hypothetical protein